MTARTIFPHFVRDLGQMWYKVRKFFPEFVPFSGQIWYKKRKRQVVSLARISRAHVFACF
ncbi:hypothetical protein HMPREF1583_01116 [Gardnerella vaginalis JCP8151B]|nr:hypothetical protein HMPREF1583_01116 [Gardnerella vaginalis JCP8151B]